MLSDPTSRCVTPWKMSLIKIFSAIFTGVSTTIPPPSPAAIPTVYDAPVPALEIQSIFLDVFPSEKVEFSCSIAGSSDWTFTWSRDGQEVQESDPNVSLFAEGSILKLSAATQTYSGSYNCKGHHKTKNVITAASNSLGLTVNAYTPKPTLSRTSNFNKMYPGESITFTCVVHGSSGWEYMWYHDGNLIQGKDSTYFIRSIDHSNSGQYHCKASRGKADFYTDNSPTTTLQVSDPPKPSLRLLTPWTNVFENETVGFSCDIDSSGWTITWYKDQEQVLEDYVLVLDMEDSLLNVTEMTEEYEGIYACRAQLESRSVSSEFSNTINISIYENLPKPTVTVTPGINQMYVGEIVNFTCNVDVASGWTYQWYKDGEFLPQSSKTNSITLNLSAVGMYGCSATRGEVTSTEISEEIRQDVIEIPVPSLKATEHWLDVFPGESVQLSCLMDKESDWIYTWYKDGKLIQANNAIYLGLNGPTLTIKSASAAHAGRYTCKGDLKDRPVSSHSSPGCNLTVYDSKPTVTLNQDPDFEVMFLGESLSFSCHINISSGWEYLWYKDEVELNISQNKHMITSVGTANQGSYKCQARRGTNQSPYFATSRTKQLEVQENKPKPSITQQPDVNKVYVGESVSMNCKVQVSSGWEYMWYKDGTQVSTNSSRLSIDAAYLTNSGTYTCMARRNKNTFNTAVSDGRILHVSEIPTPSIKLLTQWMDVFPMESVKLHCGMSDISEWTYTWCIDGKKVQASNAVSFDSDATTLSIQSASSLHHGKYSCSAKLKSRSVTSGRSSGLPLHVHGSKPRVTLIQEPGHDVMHTGDPVSFSCHINISTGWEYLWYKDDNQLVESGNNYTITSLLTKDSGSYKCQTKRGRSTVFYSDQSQTARLNVEERPKADIILMTGWSEAFSTDSLVLSCSVPESQLSWNWNYTWFKEDEIIDVPPSEKYIVTPQNDPDQSMYTCKGIRHGRPSYSKISEQFKTKNLLLKRRVLLSISGCIFFGIILVFLGCIILRVVRKPAEQEYKPEEAELFLRMDQIKGLDDEPCPLFQFITDAELNSSSKDNPAEGEENTLADGETTPLPITSQEDLAETTESHGTSENGGLVSFKQ
ncbi:obscurin-like protein 1 isoform X2 [Antennarius striatus]|uniref:obscurin-like protein 1 isoform X2 n=1 Tax=Antennarius striatus TaxID=241820 RepID=UPI0035AEC409